MPEPTASAAPRLLAGVFLLAFAWGTAHAVGLGELAVQSHLGQNLRAVVALVGAESEDALRGCVKARLQSADGGAVVPATVTLGRERGALALTVTTAQKIYEPAVTLTVELACEGRTQREYAILLDPVDWQVAPEAPRNTAVGVPAPAAQTPPVQQEEPAARASAAMPAPRRAPAKPAALRGVPPRREASAQPAAPAKAVPAQRPAASAPAPIPAGQSVAPAGATRNVLRLSTAGDAPAGAMPDEETERRLKAVQARLLALESKALTAAQPAGKAVPAEPAVFTGSIDETERKLKEVQAKIRALQIETEKMSTKELPKPAAVLPQAQPPAAAPVAAPVQADTGLLTALGGLLAVCVAVIVGMGLRMRQMKKDRDVLDPY